MNPENAQREGSGQKTEAITDQGQQNIEALVL